MKPIGMKLLWVVFYLRLTIFELGETSIVLRKDDCDVVGESKLHESKGGARCVSE